jgi:hypothetical protein
MSKESGRPEIHVATFPSFKQKRQVSNGGGCAPHWRKDGKELFYLGLDGKMRSVDLKVESALETSPPRVLFQTGLPVDADSEPYEVTGDGKRFLYGEPVGENNVSITVVLNWAAGLKRQCPGLHQRGEKPLSPATGTDVADSCREIPM